MGILKNMREFKAPGAGKEHTSEVRGGDRDPGVNRTGSGVGRPTERSRFLSVCAICVLLFSIKPIWGIVTVPGSIPCGSRPGVAGSSPFTLTTSLALPCVCFFLTRYWRIFTVPGSVPFGTGRVKCARKRPAKFGREKID